MLTVLLLAAQLATSPATLTTPPVDPSFAEAKARADEYEAVLSARDSKALVDAQGRALEAALSACGPAKAAFGAFTVVVRVGADGVVDRIWRNSDSDFAVCMERELTRVRLPVAAGKPFHASYELSFAP